MKLGMKGEAQQLRSSLTIRHAHSKTGTPSFKSNTVLARLGKKLIRPNKENEKAKAYFLINSG